MASSREDFDRSVFINCPFDDKYAKLLRPLLFTVLFLGFRPRIASERLDSLEPRIDKICELIQESRFSIHDLSRLKAQQEGELSRMNMPFELGIEYGSRRFGPTLLREKRCLVLEKEPHDFRRALSDLAGIDIKHHKNQPVQVVRVVRDWLRETGKLKRVEGPTGIWNRFNDFTSDFYDRRKSKGFSSEDLNMMPVMEYIEFIDSWLTPQRSG